MRKVSAEIKAHLEPNSGIDKTWKRNALLAWLRFSFCCSASSGPGDASERIPLLWRYLKEYGHASTAYNDVRPFAEQLEVGERMELVRLLTGNSNLGISDRKNSKHLTSKALSLSNHDVS